MTDNDFNINLIQRINGYWTQRAKAFGKVRENELQSEKAELWWQEIKARLPADRPKLTVLDAGTGAGFFSCLLSGHGHAVTGIDLSQAMLDEAASTAAKRGFKINFIQMEVSDLKFADESFDCVLGRNIIWTLPEPEKAYREWRRVLKPGGLLLSFDADYGSVNFNEFRCLDGDHAHSGISDDLMTEAEELRRLVPLSHAARPQWDLDLLNNLGLADCFCDITISERIFRVRDATFNPVPMFALGGYKR